MKKTLISVLVLMLATVCAASAAQWDTQDDIIRLKKQIPAAGAFGGAKGVVWRSNYEFDLLADGTKKKVRQVIVSLADDAPDEFLQGIMHFPISEGADMTVDSASYHSPDDGAKLGEIKRELRAEGSLRSWILTIPEAARGRLIAISTTETSPMQYYLDDVVEFAGPLPIWEQRVSVTVPSGMDVYYESIGVLQPVKEDAGRGRERLLWTTMNQQALDVTGIVSPQMPMIIFSLRRGSAPLLMQLANEEITFKAPAMPHAVSSASSNVMKFGAAVQSVMREKLGSRDERSHRALIRDLPALAMEERWTLWEAGMTALKWFQQAGFDAVLYWAQRYPVSMSGPSSMELLECPVLRIEQGGGRPDIYFTCGQSYDFGRTDPELYGRTIFRFADGDVERLAISGGSAQEHRLQQSWKLVLSDDGTSSGKLDLDLSGAWVDLLGLRNVNEADEALRLVIERFDFSLPGLSLTPDAFKKTPTGCRLSMALTASLGIVSGNDILMKMPSCLPTVFSAIPENLAGFDLKFPFVMEHRSETTTPKGYRPIMLPPKVQQNASKFTLETFIEHWPKKRRANAEYKWAVRDTHFDGDAAKVAAEQLRQLAAWSALSVPLRNK